MHYRINPHTGKYLLVGSQQSLSSLQSEAIIPDLASGATYTIQVKVRTTMGDSDYSTPTIASTVMEKTELEVFRESLGLDTIKSNIIGKLCHSTVFRSYSGPEINNTGNILFFTHLQILEPS